MGISSIVQYILLGLLAAFTLFNLFIFTVGRKRRRAAQHSHQETMAALEQEAMAVVKKEKVSFETKLGYMNDQSQGVLLTFDKQHELVGIFLRGQYYLIWGEQFISATQRYETRDDKKVTDVVVDVETEESIITVTFATRAYRPSSYLGKFILSDSQDFATRITEHLRPPGR